MTSSIVLSVGISSLVHRCSDFPDSLSSDSFLKSVLPSVCSILISSLLLGRSLLLQCDDSIDSNIAHHYYANIKKKFKILGTPEIPWASPIGKIFNFLDVKNHKIAIARSLCILAILVRKETPLKM